MYEANIYVAAMATGERKVVWLMSIIDPAYVANTDTKLTSQQNGSDSKPCRAVIILPNLAKIIR